MGFGFLSSVLSSVPSWLGAQRRLRRPRRSRLAFSTIPLTHGAYAGVTICWTCSSSQNLSTSAFLKWEPPSDMKDLGTAYSWNIRLSDVMVVLLMPTVLSLVPHTKP